MKKIMLVLTIFLGLVFGIDEVDAKTITFKDKNLCEQVYLTATDNEVNLVDVIHNKCSSNKTIVFDDENFGTINNLVIDKKYNDFSGLDNFNINKIVINLDNDFNTFDLVNISNLTSISGLNINCNGTCILENFGVLSSFSALKELSIFNVFVDTNVIGSLTNLNSLTLNNSGISDINFLSGLTNLKKIYLKGNNILDISLIKNMQLSSIIISDECNVNINEGEKLNINGNNCTVEKVNIDIKDQTTSNDTHILTLETTLIIIGSIVVVAGVSIAVMLRKKKDNN